MHAVYFGFDFVWLFCKSSEVIDYSLTWNHIFWLFTDFHFLQRIRGRGAAFLTIISLTVIVLDGTKFAILLINKEEGAGHGKLGRADIQWLKKVSQCFAIFKRMTCHKSGKLSNNLKIIYVIVHHLRFLTSPRSCDLD